MREEFDMHFPASSSLSSCQLDVWTGSLLSPELPQYNIVIYDRVLGPLDLDVMRACLAKAAQRHEALRLRFHTIDGVPEQWADPVPPEVRVVDLCGAEDPTAACADWLRNSFNRPFALTVGVPLELTLLRRDQSTSYVHLRAHHIVTDAWGLYLVMTQVRADYEHVMRTGEHLQQVAPSYLATVATDAEYRGSARQEEDRIYFRRTLAGVEPALFTRKASSGSRSVGRYSFTIEHELVDRIRDRGESPFVYISAAVSIYLSRVHRADDVVLGIPLLNRHGQEMKNTVGHFANTLPLRVSTRPDQSLNELLSQVRARTRTLLRHERLALGEVLRDLPERDGRGMQLFDTTISYLRWPTPAELLGLSYSTVAQTHAHDQDALAMWIYEFDGVSDLLVDVEYARDVFDEDFPVKAAAEHILTLLRKATDLPDVPLRDIPMLTDAQLRELLVAHNDTVVDHQLDTTLPELFAQQAVRTPDRAAIISAAGERLTFAELKSYADHLAKVLRADGVGPDDRVAILLERDTAMIVAILGALTAGGAYVPIDPSYPPERIRLLLDHCGAKVVLVENTTAELTALARDRVVRNVGQLPPIADEPLNPIAGPRDLAYVIYTSGSTGQPKGVMVEHRSVVNRLQWMQRCYPIGESDVLLQKTPVSFDVSVWELFWWAITGARLALPPLGAEKDPALILHAIANERVSVVHFVPSMLGPFLNLLEDDPELRAQAASLCTVFCSGEALPPAKVEQFNRVFGSAAATPPRLVNLYGPTEATVDVSSFACPTDPGPIDRVPIGRPIDNISLYVLGPGDSPQPQGAPGELCIGGVGVARGYLDQPELTAQRFVNDPFTTGGRLYKTGDLARWLADGTLEYLGRLDDQVKVRGNRVELSEVRDRLAAVPGVRDAVVVDQTSTHRGVQLVGYYVADREIGPTALRAHLAAELPEFMLPSYFVRIANIPLTRHGKLDRRALPAPNVVSADAPLTTVQARLASIWADVLGVDRVGAHDNYFAIGGDSILMLRIRSRAKKEGLHFTLADLHEHPTITELAERVSADPVAHREQEVPRFALVSDVDRPGLGWAEDAFPASKLSLGMLYHTLQDQDTAVYRDVFRYVLRVKWDEQAFRLAFSALVARHPSLRTSFELARYSEPLQVVHRTVDGGLTVVDLRSSCPADAETAVLAHVEQRRHHRYELQQPPLYLFAAHVRGSTVDLVLSFHHAILDGWSAATLVVELLRDYRYRMGAQVEPVCAQGPWTAAVHAFQEQRVLDSAQSRRFWQDRLTGAKLVRLDGFRPHEPMTEPGFVAHRTALPPELQQAVARFAADHAVAVKTLLFAAHCLTLRLFTGARDLTTGLVTHGRPEVADAERITGLFLNTMPVRVVTNQHSWLGVVREVARQEHESQPHRHYPLSVIQSDCGSALFATAFNYVNLHVLAQLSRLPGVHLEGFAVWEQTNFELFVNIITDPLDGHLYLRVDTDGRSITRDQADLLARTYLRVLDRIVSNPTEPVDFEFLAPANRPITGTGPLVGVLARFADQVARSPEAVAVAFGDDRWTYHDLDHVTTTVAKNLRQHGVRHGAHIGVALTRSLNMIGTVLGILKAGAVCVPLDVSYPEHRLAAILTNSQPMRVVANPQHAHLVDDPATVLPVAELFADTEPHDPAPLPEVDLDDIACILFTSGSTGQPKGVQLPHRMWANYVQWQLNVPSGAPGATTLQFAPLSFDMSFQEIFSTLCGGGTLRLVSEDERLDPAGMLRLLECYEVERVLLPFVALQQLAQTSVALGLRPAKLRIVVSSGEQLRVTEEIRRFCAAVPGTLLENQYGPTETHQVSSFSMTGDPATFPDLPPIGTPLDGVEIRVLGADRKPVPLGVAGEIYLGGNCLARGYYRQPELTECSFVANKSGKRFYRTGDLGRWLPSGDVVWLGRADNQVKVRGFRIEPAEVELAIMRAAERHGGIGEAAVVARRRDEVDSFLAAFLVGDSDSVDLDDLAKQVRGLLPDYMVPAHFTWVPQFPLTPSGKRDDAALRRIPLTTAVFSDHTPPRDEYERTLVDILSELLHVPLLGVHDNFFSVGGSSLAAMQVVVTIEKRYGVNVPLSTFVATPTVAGLAERLRLRSALAEFDPLVPIRAEGSRPPLFLVHPLGGHVLCYLRLARKLPVDLPVYALQAPGSDSGTVPLRSIPELATSYLDAIRRVQREGPYTLGGWSFGGFVAFEMTRQLRESNPALVHELLVLDSITVQHERANRLTDDTLLELFFWELIWFERGQAPDESLPKESATLEEKFEFIMRRAVSMGVLPRGTSPAAVRRLFDMFKANWRALLDYSPPAVDFDFTLVRAEGDLPNALRPMHDAAATHHLDPLNGWRSWTTGVLNIIDVPGDHLGLVEEPAVGFVAQAIMERLDGTTGRSRRVRGTGQ